MRSAASSSAARSSGATLAISASISSAREGKRFGRQRQAVEARGQVDHRRVAARAHIGDDGGDGLHPHPRPLRASGPEGRRRRPRSRRRRCSGRRAWRPPRIWPQIARWARPSSRRGCGSKKSPEAFEGPVEGRHLAPASVVIRHLARGRAIGAGHVVQPHFQRLDIQRDGAVAGQRQDQRGRCRPRPARSRATEATGPGRLSARSKPMRLHLEHVLDHQHRLHPFIGAARGARPRRGPPSGSG